MELAIFAAGFVVGAVGVLGLNVWALVAFTRSKCYATIKELVDRESADLRRKLDAQTSGYVTRADRFGASTREPSPLTFSWPAEKQ